MAISGGDWASATDPFVLATALSIGGSSTDHTNNKINLTTTVGFLNGLVDHEAQELLWQRDNDPDKSFPVNAVEVSGGSGGLAAFEFGDFEFDNGAGFDDFFSRDLLFTDPKTVWVYITGKASGANLYNLFAYVAYAWMQRDPAQILFSWIVHHATNPAVATLKTYLDQTSFQDASDYYDDNPIDLNLYREVGMTIARQINKVMQHTSDFLSIRPSDSDGAVKMFIHTRRDLTERATAIDLTSRSVRTYSFRATDRHTIDRLANHYGSVIFKTGTGFADSPDKWLLSIPPTDLPQTSRDHAIQIAGPTTDPRVRDFDLPYYIRRDRLLSHIDLSHWSYDQDEIEIAYADWTHLNFDAGDLVPITGRGYDGTEKIIVTEKTLDLDTMLATVRLLRLHGIQGKNPRHADEPNLLLALRPNTLGYYFDAEPIGRKIGVDGDPRALDRWINEADPLLFASEMTRGTPPDQPAVAANVRRRLPVVNFDGADGLRCDDITNAAVSNYTCYWVGDPDDTFGANSRYLLHVDGADDLVFALSGAGTNGKVQFYDGAWQGTVDAITGWQILTFILDSGGATIRRNGADIETSLSYTQRRIYPAAVAGVGVSAGGTGAHFDGDFAELLLYDTAHSSGTVDDIEAHLAEKYGITI